MRFIDFNFLGSNIPSAELYAFAREAGRNPDEFDQRFVSATKCIELATKAISHLLEAQRELSSAGHDSVEGKL